VHFSTIAAGLHGGVYFRAQVQAFVEKDALMCGYCTPGFIMSLTALFKRNAHPTADEIKHACAGNICRCGTQPHILQAAAQVAGTSIPNKTELINHA